ncbi:glycosyltransferase family 39 protein [Paenibacillus thalictri]|uniref:Glycosyltransferase RgtA/B/C/D-like domain-containing protein n=1 Tax=Paenibacillus thalictri TaxID=2527873 RepID=A0A4Q9DP70_9BACL|nr:glycosyltransferase family 39 protein [Paenibacillus thalictri]TBL77277.1 hypothetical protein EYB31_17485 [Paenibacillus thalictri]
MLLQLYHKLKDRDFIYYIPLALLSLDVRLRYLLYLLSSGKGLPYSEDAQWYIDYAQNLIATFSIGHEMNDLMYIGFNVLLALLLAIVKDPLIVMYIQVVTAALSVILVYKIARILFNRTTAILAGYFFHDLWDITLWTVYVLADSFFISLLLLCVYFLLQFKDTGKKAYKILFIVSAIYMLVFKPTGIVMVMFIAIYLLLNTHRETIFTFLKKHRLAIGGSLTILIIASLSLYLGHKLDPLITSMQFNAKKVLYNIYAKGWIYDKPSNYDHFFRPDYTINIFNSLILSFLIHNWDHILVIYARRALAFLGRWVWDIDLHSKRGIVKFADNLMPSLLFILSTVSAFKTGTFRKASILWLIVLAIFIFCIVFFIDGLYRYRAPAIPFIVIIVGYGAERIIYAAIYMIKKYTGKLLWKKKKYSL